jgi:hypothetical protein
MSTDFPGLRAGYCAFTFSDGRCCNNLRHPTHPHLCYPHARKEAAQLAEKQAGISLCHEIKRNYVTASDLTWTVSRVFEAVATGRLKPKTARTLAYLAQIMAQTIPLPKTNSSNLWEAKAGPPPSAKASPEKATPNTTTRPRPRKTTRTPTRNQTRNSAKNHPCKPPTLRLLPLVTPSRSHGIRFYGGQSL